MLFVSCIKVVKNIYSTKKISQKYIFYIILHYSVVVWLGQAQAQVRSPGSFLNFNNKKADCN